MLWFVFIFFFFVRLFFFFFSSRRRHTRFKCDWSSDVCSSDLFSHHQCVANSRALAEAGVVRATPDPPGGEIARDKSGEPTGLLFERALSRVETASREAWEARFTEVARAASRRYAALGITART